jgi:hypothetical protein
MAGITIDPVSTLDSRLALVEIDTKDQSRNFSQFVTGQRWWP